MEKEKTEKIDVPSFDGFECIGVKVPIGDDYALNHDGDKLVHTNELMSYAKAWAQLCYRKIKPKRIVLESTGEARLPKKGDVFIYQGKINVAFSNFEMDKHVIYRIVEE